MNSPSQDRSSLEAILISPGERRRRAGWRLLLQTLLLFVIGGCLGSLIIILVVVLNPSLLNFAGDIPPELMLLSVIGEAIAITLSVFLARHFLDKRSIGSLGLKLDKQTIFDLLAGVGITFMQMGCMYLLMTGLGWISFQGFAWQFDPPGLVIKNTLLFFVVFIFVAWSEGLLCRGYQLQTLTSGLNLFWGVILSSAIFGVLHIFNPGANWASTLRIFLAGLFFAYG